MQDAIGPKQNRIERRAQLVTEHGEKTVLGSAGRLRVFLCLLQFAINTAAFDEKADLTAERGNQLQEVRIRLGKMMAEQFDYAIHRATSEKRESKTAAQPCFYCDRLAREIFVDANILNPRRLVRFPNPARQSFPAVELDRHRVF